MALQILLSDWLAWGCIVFLLVGAGAMLFLRMPPIGENKLPSWSLRVAREESWRERWDSYAEVRGNLGAGRSGGISRLGRRLPAG